MLTGNIFSVSFLLLLRSLGQMFPLIRCLRLASRCHKTFPCSLGVRKRGEIEMLGGKTKCGSIRKWWLYELYECWAAQKQRDLYNFKYTSNYFYNFVAEDALLSLFKNPPATFDTLSSAAAPPSASSWPAPWSFWKPSWRSSWRREAQGDTVILSYPLYFP